MGPAKSTIQCHWILGTGRFQEAQRPLRISKSLRGVVITAWVVWYLVESAPLHHLRPYTSHISPISLAYSISSVTLNHTLTQPHDVLPRPPLPADHVLVEVLVLRFLELRLLCVCLLRPLNPDGSNDLPHTRVPIPRATTISPPPIVREHPRLHPRRRRPLPALGRRPRAPRWLGRAPRLRERPGHRRGMHARRPRAPQDVTRATALGRAARWGMGSGPIKRRRCWRVRADGVGAGGGGVCETGRARHVGGGGGIALLVG